MPVMNFDLEDGKPPVSFTLKPDDCARFVAFMKECDASLADAARYRWLRSIGHDQLNAAMHYGLEALDKFVDDARGVKEGGNGHD